MTIQFPHTKWRSQHQPAFHGCDNQTGLKTIIPSGAGSRGWGAGQWAWPSADGDDNIVLGL